MHNVMQSPSILEGNYRVLLVNEKFVRGPNYNTAEALSKYSRQEPIEIAHYSVPIVNFTHCMIDAIVMLSVVLIMEFEIRPSADQVKRICYCARSAISCKG